MPDLITPTVEECVQEMDNDPVAEFLQTLDHSLDNSQAIRTVIEYFENLLQLNLWDECRQTLSRADVDELETPVALAFLSMTFIERTRLDRERSEFYRKLEIRLQRERGVDKARQLLTGLK